VDQGVLPLEGRPAVLRGRADPARAGRAHLAGLAAETGFYDQSHMTAEFRALMGVPPAAYAEGRLPVARGCSSVRG
jgi:AraC-like DNA-binding protein